MQHSIPSQPESNEQCFLASTGTPTTVSGAHAMKQYRKKTISLIYKLTKECPFAKAITVLNIFINNKRSRIKSLMCLFTIGCWMNTLGFLPKVIAHTCQRETLTTENTLKIY